MAARRHDRNLSSSVFSTRSEISYFQVTPLFSFNIITHNDVFGDFPKFFDHFPKIFMESIKVVRRPDERFRTFKKIAEDCQGLLSTSKEDPKMF